MENFEQLENLVYALTLADRKNKRKLWVQRGFKKVQKRQNFLLNYWKCRLQLNRPKDMVLYQNILDSYLTTMRKAEESKQVMQRGAADGGKRAGLRKRYTATVPEMMQSAAEAAKKWISGGMRTLPAARIKE